LGVCKEEKTDLFENFKGGKLAVKRGEGNDRKPLGKERICYVKMDGEIAKHTRTVGKNRM